MGSSGVEEKDMTQLRIHFTQLFTTSAFNSTQSSASLAPPCLVDLLHEMSNVRMIKEQTDDFISRWYTTNGEGACDVLWIDSVVEQHIWMKTFFNFALSEANRNPDNFYISELRFLSFASMTGLIKTNANDMYYDEKCTWYSQSAINFMGKCFFGEGDESEANFIPLKNRVLRKKLENINQTQLKDINIKEILPLVYNTVRSVLEDCRLERKYLKFKKTMSV